MKNIEIVKNFIFIAQDVIIKGYTPMALQKINNIQNIEKKEMFNKAIYVLEKGIKNEDKNGFNITCKISNTQLIHENESVILSVFDKKKEEEKKIECYIEKNTAFITLICKPKYNIVTNLYGSFVNLKNEILVIAIKNGKNNTVDFRYNYNNTIINVITVNKKTKKIKKLLLYSALEIIVVIIIIIIYCLIYYIKTKVKNNESITINYEKKQIQFPKNTKRKIGVGKRNKVIKKSSKDMEKEEEKEEESYPLKI